MSTDASGGGRPAAERLRELQRLLDDGLISEQEFEAQRARILDEALGSGDAPIGSDPRERGSELSRRRPDSRPVHREEAASPPRGQPETEPSVGGDAVMRARGPLHPARWPSWLRIVLIVISGVWLITLPFMLSRRARFTWLPYVGVATIAVLAFGLAVSGESEGSTPASTGPAPRPEPPVAASVPTPARTPEPTPEGSGIGDLIEPPRECWRLQSLRGWSDDTTRPIPQRRSASGRSGWCSSTSGTTRRSGPRSARAPRSSG